MQSWNAQCYPQSDNLIRDNDDVDDGDVDDDDVDDDADGESTE